MAKDKPASLDLAHLIRIAAILDGIPGDTDLPHAMVALEDAFVVCALALKTGVSLDFARETHRAAITKEETRRVLAEHRSAAQNESGHRRPADISGADYDGD